MEIEKQAIIAYLAGEADEQDCQRLAQWCSDPVNEREFQRISRFWVAVDDFPGCPEEVVRPSAEQIVESATDRRQVDISPSAEWIVERKRHIPYVKHYNSSAQPFRWARQEPSKRIR